jgi:thymidylate synthase (FAD)
VPGRDAIRTQVGKPGAYTFERVDDDRTAYAIQERIAGACALAFGEYQAMLDHGIAKEVARVVLPVSMYSRMKWTCNLRSLMHFVGLRNSEHAQAEIREYAQAVEFFAELVCPVAMREFVENGRVAP